MSSTVSHCSAFVEVAALRAICHSLLAYLVPWPTGRTTKDLLRPQLGTSIAHNSNCLRKLPTNMTISGVLRHLTCPNLYTLPDTVGASTRCCLLLYPFASEHLPHLLSSRRRLSHPLNERGWGKNLVADSLSRGSS